METIGYWICFFVGVLVGKYILTSDFIKKLRERITGKRVRTRSTRPTNKTFDAELYDICPDCQGEEFVYDTKLRIPVKCPTCKGSGKIKKHSA